jgi:hypothetical protein
MLETQKTSAFSSKFAVQRGVLRLTSSATLEPQKTGFYPHEIAPQEILLLEEIPG